MSKAPKGKYDGYWEMNVGGPYDSPEEIQPVFKCTGCGAETDTDTGHNGEPIPGRCRKGCHNHERVATDWRPGAVSRAYADNYARIFGHD